MYMCSRNWQAASIDKKWKTEQTSHSHIQLHHTAKWRIVNKNPPSSQNGSKTLGLFACLFACLFVCLFACLFVSFFRSFVLSFFLCPLHVTASKINKTTECWHFQMSRCRERFAAGLEPLEATCNAQVQRSNNKLGMSKKALETCETYTLENY